MRGTSITFRGCLYIININRCCQHQIGLKKKARWLGDWYSYLAGKYRTFKVESYNFVFWFNESRKRKSKGMKMEQSCTLDEQCLNQLVPFMLHTLQGTTKKSFINTAIRSAQIIDAKLCRRSSMILHQRRRSQCVEKNVKMNNAR